MAHAKPDYKDFITDEQCPECKRVMLWWDFYSTYCANCDYEYHNSEAESEDYADIKRERDFLWNEAGGNDAPDRYDYWLAVHYPGEH